MRGRHRGRDCLLPLELNFGLVAQLGGQDLLIFLSGYSSRTVAILKSFGLLILKGQTTPSPPPLVCSLFRPPTPCEPLTNCSSFFKKGSLRNAPLGLPGR